MKHSLIRILTIMTLASSISAFAGSDKHDAKKTNSDKTNCEATAAPSDSSKADRSEAQSDEEHNKDKSERQRLIEEQNKQWLHDVQNIVSG